MPRLTVRDSVGVSLQSVTFTKGMVEDLLRCGDHGSVAAYIGKTIAARYREQLFLPEFCQCVDSPVVVPDDFLMGYEFEFISVVPRELAAEIFTHVLSSVYNPCCDVTRFHITACSGYHAVDRSRETWIFESDGSVKSTDDYPSVIELITPPLKADACFAFLPLIFSFISAIGQTNDSCGLHFTVGGKKLRSSLDGLEFFTQFSQSTVLSEFHREDNHYCAPVTLDCAWFQQNSLEKYAASATSDVAMVMNREKYHSINFSKLGRGLIELRAMGGAKYETKLKSVLSVSKKFLDTVCRATQYSYKHKSHNFRKIIHDFGGHHHSVSNTDLVQEPPTLLSGTVPILREIGLQFFAGCARRDPDVVLSVDACIGKTDKPVLHIRTRFQYFAAQFSFKGFTVNLRAYVNPFGTLVFVVSNAMLGVCDFQRRSLLYRTIRYLAEHLPKMLGFACHVAWDLTDAEFFVSALPHITKTSNSAFVALRRSLALQDSNHIMGKFRSLPDLHNIQSMQDLFGTSIEPLTALHNNISYVSSPEFLSSYLVYLREAYNSTQDDYSCFVECLVSAIQSGASDLELLREVYLLAAYAPYATISSSLCHKCSLSSAPVNSKINALLLLFLSYRGGLGARAFITTLNFSELSGILKELVSFWRIQAAVASDTQCATSVSSDILVIISTSLSEYLHFSPSCPEFIASVLTEIASCPSPIDCNSRTYTYLELMLSWIMSSDSMPFAARRFFFEAIMCGSHQELSSKSFQLHFSSSISLKAILVSIMQDYLCTGDLRLLRVLVQADHKYKNCSDDKTHNSVVTSALWEALSPVSCGFSSLHYLIRVIHISQRDELGIKYAPSRILCRLKSLISYPTGTKFCSAIDMCSWFVGHSGWRAALQELIYAKPVYFKDQMILASRIDALFMLRDRII